MIVSVLCGAGRRCMYLGMRVGSGGGRVGELSGSLQGRGFCGGE